ncbi:unnamed protein product [Didymodactylos carnosus]|uniref:ABC transporter domain-containing protein n=1 Tax=Didymodactylos carnosus TaxID=1234261 RepID=A0A814ECP9_9BILA|nr:unnamed protein product [Didymodactylos carnosus]CAF3742313.1 unnamed protein product [Didymodactylos carnosus]
MASCLLHNVGLSLGAQLIGQFEGKGTGLQWSMINQGFSVDDNFTMVDVLIMLYADALIYLIIALYIEKIWPGQYGVPKSWYFPFTLTYWRGHAHNNMNYVAVDATNGLSPSESTNEFEEEPKDKALGISLFNVSKVYSFFLKTKQPIHAVRNVSLNIYNGQLTALLGHNGAGKSTTISMITGYIPPTTGQIVVNGFDIATSIDKVRDNLGLCPQYNILFDYLTVKEHLKLFAILKGHPSNDVENEIQKMVKDLNLEDKLNTLSKALSGGMKRKLSVGIALIADSKIVILDEPTSGMDPAARRSTWDMLQRYRTDRTILFTTHFMDEADILSDRIAIIGDGRIRCCGSPFFLKTKYGVGYHLILSKNVEADVENIVQIVQKHVPLAQLESNISAECSILLPHASSAKFPDLFDEIEQKKDSLQIFSIGLSETSIEEVFMKIVETEELTDTISMLPEKQLNNGFQEDTETIPDNGHYSNDDAALVTINSTSETIIAKNSDISLWIQQLKALLLKRILNSARNYLVLFATFLPAIFVIISLIIEQQIPRPEDSPPLLITADRYSWTRVPYTYDTNSSISTAFANIYRNITAHSDKETPIDLTKPFQGDCHDLKPMNLLGYLGCIGRLSVGKLTDHYLIAADIHEYNNYSSNDNKTDLHLIGLFNNQPFHVPPLTLNELTNSLLHYYSITDNYTNNSFIKVINHPLPRSSRDELNDFQSKQFFGFRLSSSIVFGMGFAMASFAVFLIKERVSKAKHLQFLSGANAANFWISTIIWDAVYYLIPTVCIYFVWWIFYHTDALKEDIGVFITGPRLGYTILLFALYGWAHIPYTYLLSYLFQIPSSGFAWITIINIITSQATLLAVVILAIPQLNLVNISKILEWIFLILFPNYSLAQAFNDIYSNHEYLKICPGLSELCPLGPNPCCKNNCGSDCIDWSYNYLDWHKPGIGRFIVFLFLQGLISFTLLLLIDFGIAHRFKSFVFSCGKKNQKEYTKLNSNTSDTITRIAQPITNQTTTEAITTDDLIYGAGVLDDDVKNEEERIQQTPTNRLMETDVLVLNNVSKVHGMLRAVDKVSFGVKKQECFGLLGVNGAGKTTIFKMITGDELASNGSIVLDHLDINTNMRRAQRKMGYCPQFDALIDLLTGEETLYLFARLRGVMEIFIPNLVRDIITLMNLDKHAKKYVYAYSGGNRRKLSAAVALIGDPAIIFLDEPTTGMDPKARRYFWNAIAKFRDCGKPIILTSHSMEECEALCTRIAIMVNGRLKCLGSIQHLKSKYGQGYTLVAKLNSFTEDKINDFFNVIKNTFPNAQFKEAYEGYIHIHIDESNLSFILAKLFRIVESCKQKYNIENYTVSQTTLEQVFLTFAKSQLDPDELKHRLRKNRTLFGLIKSGSSS